MVPPINAMNFEELLQCPVCFELPSGAIQQCEQGHAVCQNCYRKLTNCPVCRGIFYGTRNYVMEELIDKIKRGQVGKDSDKEKISKITRRTPPPASPGIFPCKIPQCNQNLPACRMLRHLRNYHSEVLHESMTQDGLAFTRVMDILWIPHMRQVFAMQISDMGLFYLVIDNDALGTVRAWLQMVALHNIAQDFLYELNFHSSNMNLKSVFIDRVQSVKQPDSRFMSDIATPMCTKINKKCNIFNLRKDCPISRLHIAITFRNTFQSTVEPTLGTLLFKNVLNTHYPELNRQWRFELSDKNNLLQGSLSSRTNNPRITTSVVMGSITVQNQTIASVPMNNVSEPVHFHNRNGPRRRNRNRNRI